MLCWIEVDLDAVADNVRALQAAAQPQHGVTAVVKAQAYGMGALAVANAAIAAGARGAAVARLSEARLLRRSGFSAPILLLGGIDPDDCAEVVTLGLNPTVTDWPTAERLAAAAGAAGAMLEINVKVDTGITRYGAPPEEAMAIVRALHTLSALRLQSFYTHFAAADDPDPFFAHQQLARFLAICQQLEGEGYVLGLKHAANSAGALRVPGSGLDTIRAGIALTGAYATGWVPRVGSLRGAVSLKARVVRFHTPAIGSSVGYGRTYKVYRPMRVALIACGYADGLPRACSNRGRVLVRGQRAPLVGTVSMDMAMADVSHLPDVEVGDEVVILGHQGEDEISLDEFAESAGIIPHELLVRLGNRAPRVYLRSGQPSMTSTLACDDVAEVACVSSI
ncbi:MAG TPA: alanine racemase [Chloroflexota bacterium]|jgi:alanine racemase|nr:alanine racemase [Chloroflexota bacterium]